MTSVPTQSPEATGIQQETHLPFTLPTPTRNSASLLLPALTSSSPKSLLLLIPFPVRMNNPRGLLTAQDSQMSLVSTCGFDIHRLGIAKEYGKYCISKWGGERWAISGKSTSFSFFQTYLYKWTVIFPTPNFSNFNCSSLKQRSLAQLQINKNSQASPGKSIHVLKNLSW